MTSWVINSTDDDWLIEVLAVGLTSKRLSAVYKIDGKELPYMRSDTRKRQPPPGPGRPAQEIAR